VPVPHFLLFLCFRSDTHEIFSELDETSYWSLLFCPGASKDPTRSRRGATGAPHTRPAWSGSGPRHPGVRPPGSTSDIAPSPIKTPRREKPKNLINFPETHRDPPPSSTQDREGLEAPPSTLPERGITTGGLLHRHACLRSDEWVVYLGLWVHSSS
jgi:hypothetical protein